MLLITSRRQAATESESVLLNQCPDAKIDNILCGFHYFSLMESSFWRLFAIRHHCGSALVCQIILKFRIWMFKQLVCTFYASSCCMGSILRSILREFIWRSMWRSILWESIWSDWLRNCFSTSILSPLFIGPVSGVSEVKRFRNH